MAANKQITNLKNISCLENEFFTLCEENARNLFESKSCQWEINAITAIHKSYGHSSTRIIMDVGNCKEIYVKKMLPELHWTRYMNYLSSLSYFSCCNLTLKSSLSNLSLYRFVNEEFLPMLKAKAHVTEKYKIGQCLKIVKKQRHRERSVSKYGRAVKYEIEEIAYTKKEAQELHRNLLNKYEIKEYIYKNMNSNLDKLISRTKIKFLKPYKYYCYDGLVYLSVEENIKEETIKIVNMWKIEDNMLTGILDNGNKFKLREGKVSDLLLNMTFEDLSNLKDFGGIPNNFCVLEIPSLYDYCINDNNAGTLPYIRKLSQIEVSELIFSYFGLSILPHVNILKQLFSELDRKSVV